MESEASSSSSSVVVYAAEEFLDLVKSCRARDTTVSTRTHGGLVHQRDRSEAARRRTEADAAARQSRSAGTYLRHQEALRALQEEQERQHQAALQNKRARDEKKFVRLMSKCSDAIGASHELGAMLLREDQLCRDKCERQYKQWSERVFEPIQDQIVASLTDDNFQRLHDLRQKMHEDYLRASERQHGVFLHVPGPEPTGVSLRYSTAKLKDPIKADLAKNAVESAMLGTTTQFDRERKRYVISPPEYLKVYPTERKHVRGPNSHKRILPNDYTELSCDEEIGHREMFPGSKRYYGSDIKPQLLAEIEKDHCRCSKCVKNFAATPEPDAYGSIAGRPDM